MNGCCFAWADVSNKYTNHILCHISDTLNSFKHFMELSFSLNTYFSAAS